MCVYVCVNVFMHVSLGMEIRRTMKITLVDVRERPFTERKVDTIRKEVERELGYRKIEVVEQRTNRKRETWKREFL